MLRQLEHQRSKHRYDDMHYTNLERKLDNDLVLEQYVKDIGGITPVSYTHLTLPTTPYV